MTIVSARSYAWYAWCVLASTIALAACATQEEKAQTFTFETYQHLQKIESEVARTEIERRLVKGSPKSNPL